MCVLALAWNVHPNWPLVLIGNRDEYHDRPAAPLGRWDVADIVAGRDLQSGGTWLGVSEAGRLAVVTNLRGFEPALADRPSRGALVTDLLEGRDPATVPIDSYNPVNLIGIADGHAHFLSNRPAPVRTALASGLYGLSNGALDAPWPKTLRLKAILLEWLMGANSRPTALLAGLGEDRLPDIGLPPVAPSDVPQEPNRSPIFIRDRVYGTRCSSIITIDSRGKGLFIERRFSDAGDYSGESVLDFTWPIEALRATR